MEWKGKILAIDLGEKRIGLAVSDATRTIAASYGVMNRKSRQADFERFARIIEEEAINLIVVGLPLTLSGEVGQRASWVRDYSAELGRKVTIPVELWDESFSTKRAEASLRARGKRARTGGAKAGGGKQARGRVDAVAAAFILQDYLDAHAEGGQRA
jgi:putative Holliday junction resolvase